VCNVTEVVDESDEARTILVEFGVLTDEQILFIAAPGPDVLRSAHRAVNAQLMVFASIPVLAVLMARGIGT
jgi:uncharacterized membrane protein